MRKLVFILITAIAFSSTFVTVSRAQAPECDPASLIAELTALKSTGDDAKDIAALVDVRDQITMQNVACNGYSFSGKSEGVIGPIDLPAGVYLMTVRTSGIYILKSTLLSGSCTIDRDEVGEYSVFILRSGDATDGAAVVISSDGCRAIFTTEGTSESWTLTIEPLK